MPSPFDRGARLGKWLPTGSKPEPATWPGVSPVTLGVPLLVPELAPSELPSPGYGLTQATPREGPTSPGEGAPGEASLMTPPGWGHPCSARGPSSLESTLVTPKVPLPRAPGTPRACDPVAQGIRPQGASSSLSRK